ncbi:MAG TPA: hypothetical protein VM261_15830 [Kofleriaceae bacterium]|nr:hypothetical protein [Kofleriaceae bacterium]
MEPAALSVASARAVELARWGLAIALVLLAFAAIALLVIAARRRGHVEPEAAEPEPEPEPAAPPPPPVPRRAAPPPIRRTPQIPRQTVALAGGALAVVSTGLVCPTCRTEYTGKSFCERDARRLVPPEEMLAGARSAGGMCTSCGRAFEAGLRRCPHDGGEIIPAVLFQATRRRREIAPTGVLAKVCPVCRERSDLSARFCGRDGQELVVIN